MSSSQITANKKDRESKKRKKRQEKDDKREDRKTNSNKGKDFSEMLAYVDEYGNLTTTPPKPAGSEDNAASGKRSDRYERGPADKTAHQGIVEFFNTQKRFGFIIDSKSKKKIFFHANDLKEPVKEQDQVEFLVEPSSKGPKAVQIAKLAN
ncbi:cold shock domain-containing protein [Flectobacillus sp. BAB-3569]|jgi:cold shock CspA family protein|uniref:cold shock domain-containing protein n=1 Tax=Flectobacillus sp. BAB-3569 TaxID=1509483 RepID=UPI000BA4740E|nr:cold shock domain-containing protein [Flectobacillus sp. BAB-3569]NBA75272.1 cold shock domain-containing protein [Emticicia sp. ODNR4P]PAC30119.1 DNA-binding protein [Flectobacillus sp. BAB-3569]